VAGSLRRIQIHDDDWLHLKLRGRSRDDREVGRTKIGGRTAGCRQAKGQNMSAVELTDVGHENALPRGELLAASAIAQFYTFASRCMDWANTARVPFRSALFIRRWDCNGSRLAQGCRHSCNCKNMELLNAHPRKRRASRSQPADAESSASQNGGLNDATDERSREYRWVIVRTSA